MFVFPRTIECDRHQESDYKGPQANLISTLEHIRAVLGSNTLLQIESFERKAFFPAMKKIWSTFSRTIAHDIYQATTYQGPKCILTNIVQLITSFLWDLRGRWKQTFQKKSCLQDDKRPFFLVSSSVTNIRDQFMRFRKLFWHLFWNI